MALLATINIAFTADVSKACRQCLKRFMRLFGRGFGLERRAHSGTLFWGLPCGELPEWLGNAVHGWLLV
jgi:hypothetical protein